MSVPSASGTKPAIHGATAAQQVHAPGTPRLFASEMLFGGALEVRITHGSQEYRLRRTRNGKLILTK